MARLWAQWWRASCSQPPPTTSSTSSSSRRRLRSEQETRLLTRCVVAIADFKRINARYGHPSGDRVLSQVGARLRQGGEAFRLGGDEFALLLADHGETTALAAAGSIVERIATV